jgi:hypothetical protein
MDNLSSKLDKVFGFILIPAFLIYLVYYLVIGKPQELKDWEDAFSNNEKVRVTKGVVLNRYRAKSVGKSIRYAFNITGVEYERSDAVRAYLYDIGDSCLIKYNIDDPNFSELLTLEEIEAMK